MMQPPWVSASAAEAVAAFPSLEEDAEAPFPEVSPLRLLPAFAPSSCLDEEEDGGAADAVAFGFCAPEQMDKYNENK